MRSRFRGEIAELVADGSPHVFDDDYCKGSGLCAHECPCGFIVMEDDQRM